MLAGAEISFRRKISLCDIPALSYHSPMKKLFSLFNQYLSAFLEFFSAPPRRGQCPHCGGGKCYGACQFVHDNKTGGKS